MTTLLNGLLGGLLAGLVAAMASWLVGGVRSGRPPDDRNRTAASGMRAVAVRSAYGGLAGGVLVALELTTLRLLAVPPTVGEAFGVAALWSALLFGSLVAVQRVAPTPGFERSRLGELLAFHLVYAVALGAWIRLTWIT